MLKNSIRIAVTGVSGRMGKCLVKKIAQSKKAKLGAALSRTSSGLYKLDAGNVAGIGALGVKISNDLSEIKEDFDVLIDFTHPDSSIMHLDFCRQYCKNIVIGTTGFSDTQKKIIYSASDKIGVVFDANFSVGISLMLRLIEQTTKAIGSECDIEIIEIHHRDKLDAPSGTALNIGQIVANNIECSFTDCKTHNYKTYNTDKIKKNVIGFTTIRSGDTIGEHTVMFAKTGERLELTHKVSNRTVFASGALRSAIWLCNQNNGLYSMADVLNL